MKDGDYIGAYGHPYGSQENPDDCHKLLIDEILPLVVKQFLNGHMSMWH